MLVISPKASRQLRKTIETINFMIALPQGTEMEKSISDGHIMVYRTAQESIVVQCFDIGRDVTFMPLLISAIEGDGYQPLKPYAGVYFYLNSKKG